MGVNGCDSFEMDETALPFTKSGFAPFSIPVPAEEQVPCSAQSLGVCLQLSVWLLPFLFSKTKTSPKEFKPAGFVLLININCKPVFLALLVGRERQYMGWGTKDEGPHQIDICACGSGEGLLEGLNWPGFESSGEKEHDGKNILKIKLKHKKLAAKKDLGKSISCEESCTHMG